MKRPSQIKDEDKTSDPINIFIKEILKFNKVHNIVGRISEEEIISLDILDCETMLEHINPSQKILDIGSGAGLPGLIIAIKQPTAQITMSEKNKKKAYFIRKMIRTLRLTNATILDKATTPKLITQNKFDVITARALAKAPIIINMAQHLLNEGGKFILMKGSIEKINEEVAQLDNNKYSYTIHKANTPNINRHILEINQK
ncbi:16S rRNA (guanine(527)-N(7))-methyltransferase RsmG [Pseudomonadota bacterium]|nr:16S rRNA (guanine(527)-N(7))-methyltransferase RsmG [Pseudomonadota bacterium]